MELLANQKHKAFSTKDNYLYINESKGIEFDPKSGVRIIIAGDPGKGKTFLEAILITQAKNVIMLDPTSGGKFKKTLSEIGVLDEWTVLRFDSKKKAKNILKFNLSEAGTAIVDAIFYRTLKDSTRRQKNALESFLKQKPEYKTWDNFKKISETYKFDHYLPDFANIFSSSDSGQTLDSIQHGKFVVEIEGLKTQSLSLGIFFAMLVEDRGNRKMDYFGNDFLFVGVDEGQTYAKINTALGNAISTMDLQARKLGIATVVAGSSYKGRDSGFHPDIRQKRNFAFIFYNIGSTEAYKNEGFGLYEDSWSELGEHECFYYDFENNVLREKVVCNTYFLKVRKMILEGKTKTRIRVDKTNYEEIINEQLYDGFRNLI